VAPPRPESRPSPARICAAVSPPTRPGSTQGPPRKDRRQQHSAWPLQGRCALHIWVWSAAEIRHPAQIAAADFVHLHQTHQASCATTFYDSAMRRDAGGSAAPVRASPAPVQPQKPKTVSRGRAGPAGRRGRRRERSGTHPKSPPIAARTEIPSALVPTATSAPS